MALPPNLRLLLEDPVYRSMFTTAPRPVYCQTVPGARPWAVYARTTIETAEGDVETRWVGRLCPTYRDAFEAVKRALRAEDSTGDGDATWRYDDIALVSRSVLYPPPPGFYWTMEYPGGHRMGWCGRCRRPSNFRIRPRHHALKKAVALTNDEPRRCYYCGMREAAMPRYGERHADG